MEFDVPTPAESIALTTKQNPMTPMGGNQTLGRNTDQSRDSGFPIDALKSKKPDLNISITTQ